MLNSSVSPLSATLEPLREAQILRARIEGLKSLLNVQLKQIEALSDKLQPVTPAGRAASRLMTLKDEAR
jgi:hypothetical protein